MGGGIIVISALGALIASAGGAPEGTIRGDGYFGFFHGKAVRPLLTILVVSACGGPAKGPESVSLPGEWKSFEGTGTATGHRQTLHLGPGRKVSIVNLTGSLLLLTGCLAVYTAITPHAELRLIRQGNAAASAALAGVLVGFAVPLAKWFRGPLRERINAIGGVAASGTVAPAVPTTSTRLLE